jgi:hypothetical protein
MIMGVNWVRGHMFTQSRVNSAQSPQGPPPPNRPAAVAPQMLPMALPASEAIL